MAVPEVLSLKDAVGKPPVAEEDRTGHTRASFRHWNAGPDPADGCDTRDEVLLTEAVQEPAAAVTARTNRSEADQDPAAWMPPLPEAHCRHIGEWTATKLHRGLAADPAEAGAEFCAEACETTVVHYDPAPCPGRGSAWCRACRSRPGAGARH